jgi:GNAT superfamily N-acetyltransferase
MEIKCRVVDSPSWVKKFIDFPHDLYKDDPHYVPEIYIGQKKLFDKKSYPFFEYGDATLFLVFRDGKIVGRIAAIDNPRYNTFHGRNVGFFGFFDCIQNQVVADVLFEKVLSHARSKGYNQIIGPVNYTTNETAGVLVDGFTLPPVVMMTYNFPYYQTLFDEAGFVKEMDLFAYFLDVKKVSKRSLVVAEKIENRLLSKGITIRKVSKKTLEKDAAEIKEIYNHAWEKNWGFIPFTEAEFDHLKEDMMQILDPDFNYVAELNGNTPVGFSITIPDINEILIKNKRGRLFPFGIFRLLFGKNKTKTMRVLALGVLPEYRRMGIEAIFFAKNIREAEKKSKIGAEASWILENNREMNQSLIKLNAGLYKTYRLYSHNL